uniref:Transcription factor Adf-1 n=1 Tax=Lygus hesperus TaxID=30085 RepID=A0A0A9WF21_LYGHE
MEINNERLIIEVQKFSCLYNIDHEEYRDKERKNRCWVIVAQRILDNEKWEDLSELEIKRISKEVQKRWKNLRDAYTRSLRSQIERGGSKPYVYEKQMSFLLPGPTLQRDQVLIKEEPEENLVICEPDVNTSHLDGPQDLDDKRYPSIGDLEVNPSAPPKKRRIRDPDRDEDYNLYLVDSNPQMSTDDDTMFLMSLAPSLRQVPPSAKLDARIKILEALKPFIPYAKLRVDQT